MSRENAIVALRKILLDRDLRDEVVGQFIDALSDIGPTHCSDAPPAIEGAEIPDLEKRIKEITTRIVQQELAHRATPSTKSTAKEKAQARSTE